jgi:hypothetical protein
MKVTHFKLLSLALFAAVLVGCNSDSKLNSPPSIGVNQFVTETGVAITDTLAAEDFDNDRLNFALVSPAANGSVSVTPGGSFTYTPTSEFTGNDSFMISVTDGGLTAQGQVSITVEVATVSFLTYSRDAFTQAEGATPLPVNGRVFTADATAEADFADLLTGQ